jgi:nitroimidazol reductase NimA-like FMN-containing flavoprotein (pyridoxamine 5'-phosphate oxidase superfamily)
MGRDFTYDDVSSYTLETSDEARLVAEQNECTFMWSNREGWPVGVVMSYVFHGGCFWLSVSDLRVRVKAVQRDPRVSISITSKGTNIRGSQAVTYTGTCEVFSDQATIDWFLPALAERLRPGDEVAAREFVRLNNTSHRRVLKVTPVQTIGFDGNKMRAATARAREQQAD